MLCAVIAGTSSFDLKCSSYLAPWQYSGIIYTCFTDNLNVSAANQSITSINGDNKPNHKILAIKIDSQQVNFFPHGLDKLMPNLNVIYISNSSLKQIAQSDLKPFASLKEFYLKHSEIEVIPDNLFIYNIELRIIDFSGNSKLKVVGENVVQLEAVQVDFINSGCINGSAYREDFLSLISRIEQSCVTAKADLE